jgi:hypothetical protein
VQQRTRSYCDRGANLRQAIRNANQLSAVIRRTRTGFRIELSNGRVCSISTKYWHPRKDAMTAAVQWAHRHGATTVEVRSEDNRAGHDAA